MEGWQLSCQVSHGWCWIRAAVIVKFKESIQKTGCGLNVLSCHVLSRKEGGEGCTAVVYDEQTNDESSYFYCFIVIEKAYEAWKLGVRMFLDCASKKTWKTVCSFYYYYYASSNFLCSFLWFNLGKGLDLMDYCRVPVGTNESDVILTRCSAEQATASCSIHVSYPS